MDHALYENHLTILRSELVMALGCTEPIAIAYAAAKARQLLGEMPEHCTVHCSGNIVKNVMGVTVPNSGGLKGIDVAATLGIVGGNPELELAVLEGVTEAHRAQVRQLLAGDFCTCKLIENVATLYIVVELAAGEHTALVEIQNTHKNITRMEKDGVSCMEHVPAQEEKLQKTGDRSLLTVDNIVDFAGAVSLEELEPILTPQIECNMAICREGLEHPYGAEVGRVLLDGNTAPTIGLKARAYAAAGSDARMSGCELPVVIVSGSGNQGITASVPVVRYARYLGVSQEKLCRALLVSDLVTIHQKSGIGRLSAYCGAVSAGVGAGAGIAYLLDGSYEAIAHTIVNAVAIISGTICDGAKPSCAAKIAASVDAGILGYSMYKNHQEFKSGDGIVTKGVDNTIANIGILAQQGMRQTDQTILSIMTERCK